MFVVLSARETIKNRAVMKHQYSLRSRTRCAQVKEDVLVKKEVKKNDTNVDLPYKDIEAMYDLIPAEYLDSNDTNNDESASIMPKKSIDEDCAILDHLFKEERNAQEMWRLLANPEGYQKALRVLGRIETRRSSPAVSKVSIRRLQSPKRRKSDLSKLELGRSRSLNADPRTRRSSSLIKPRKMWSISEVNEFEYETLIREETCVKMESDYNVFSPKQS